MATFTDKELEGIVINAMGRGSEAGSSAIMKLGYSANIINGIPSNKSGYAIGFFKLTLEM